MDSSTQPKILREIIKLRGENSKTFELDNGKNRLIATKEPMHYKDRYGNLAEIDTNIDGDKVITAPYLAKLTKDKIGFTIKRKDNGEVVTVMLERIGDKEISYQLPLIEGETALYEDVDKDIDIVLKFNNGGCRMFRILKTPEAERKAIFHIKQEKDKFGISPQFYGHDAKGRSINLKTKIILETDHEIFVEDVFTGQTVSMDEETRVRSLSNEIDYPVIIDPEVRIW